MMHLRTIGAFSDELLKIAAKELKVKLPTTKQEFHEGYRKYRKPAASAAKGALVGTLLANIAAGGRARGWRWYRLPAAVGAGAGVVDHLAMGRKPKVKKAMFGASATFTPARALSQSRATSRFQDQVVHKGERMKPPTVRNVAVPNIA